MKKYVVLIVFLSGVLVSKAQSDVSLVGSGLGILQITMNKACDDLIYEESSLTEERTTYSLCGKKSSTEHQLLEYKVDFQHHTDRLGYPANLTSLSYKSSADKPVKMKTVRKSADSTSLSLDSLVAITTRICRGFMSSGELLDGQRYVGLDFVGTLSESGGRNVVSWSKPGRYFSFKIHSVLLPVNAPVDTARLKSCFQEPERNGGRLINCIAANKVIVIEQSLNEITNQNNVFRYICYSLEGTSRQVDSLENAIVMSTSSDDIIKSRLLWDLVLIRDSKLISKKIAKSQGAAVVLDLLHQKQYNVSSLKRKITIEGAGTLDIKLATPYLALPQYLDRGKPVKEEAGRVAEYDIRSTKRTSKIQSIENSNPVLPPVILMYLIDDIKPY